MLGIPAAQYQPPEVAPYAGAWIEIPHHPRHPGKTGRVAPYAGAWIEIAASGGCRCLGGVAPYAGAWIEISVACKRLVRASVSLPTRERGLKFVLSGGKGVNYGRSLRGSVD